MSPSHKYAHLVNIFHMCFTKPCRPTPVCHLPLMHSRALARSCPPRYAADYEFSLLTEIWMNSCRSLHGRRRISCEICHAVPHGKLILALLACSHWLARTTWLYRGVIVCSHCRQRALSLACERSGRGRRRVGSCVPPLAVPFGPASTRRVYVR